MIRYYKSHVYAGALNFKPCCTDYYKVWCNRDGARTYIRFRVSLHKVLGMESLSLSELSSINHAHSPLRYFRKYYHCKPVSEAEYRKNFYKTKRRLIRVAKELKA